MPVPLEQKELWTQQEVADYFRVVPGTVRNWRRQGLLKFWKPPGAARVLYFRDDVLAFRDRYTQIGKGGDREKIGKHQEKPAMPARRIWRV